MENNFLLEVPAVKSWDTEIDDIIGYYTHHIILQNDTKIKFIVPPGVELTGEINPMSGDTTLFKVLKK